MHDEHGSLREYCINERTKHSPSVMIWVVHSVAEVNGHDLGLLLERKCCYVSL